MSCCGPDAAVEMFAHTTSIAGKWLCWTKDIIAMAPSLMMVEVSTQEEQLLPVFALETNDPCLGSDPRVTEETGKKILLSFCRLWTKSGVRKSCRLLRRESPAPQEAGFSEVEGKSCKMGSEGWKSDKILTEWGARNTA